MEIRRKLTILADAAKYDASCASSGSRRAEQRQRSWATPNSIGICHSYTPDGRCVSLLKILLTNYCIYDCQYCVNRVTSDTPRARFTPDEVVNLTLEFYQAELHRGTVPQLRHHPKRRLHDGAVDRGGALAARGAPLQRLHPSQGRAGRVGGIARAGGAVCRPAQREYRIADAGRSAASCAGKEASQ